MKIEKWLYFRTVADEDDDNGDTGSVGNKPTSICIPASAIKAIGPGGSASVSIKFHNLITAEDSALGKRRNYDGNDVIKINTTEGKTFEVMEALTRLIHSNSVSDGFTVIADDMTTNFANEVVKPTYFHPDVTSCGDITAFEQPQGTGIHEYYEEIQCDAVADANEEVVGSLSISLQSHCILLEGALTAITLSNHADSSVALNFHDTAVADRTEAGGTEYIGAGAFGGGTAQNAVVTMTFAGALVTSNTIDMNIDGVALTQVDFDTDSDTTMAAVATAIEALAQIKTATVTNAGSSDRVIVITAKQTGVDLDFSGITVAGGSSQTTAVIANTILPFTNVASIPDTDLNCGTAAGGDVQFDTVHSGTYPPVDRGGAVTHFALKTCEDSSNATSNAKIGVYIKWWGRPALSIANA